MAENVVENVSFQIYLKFKWLTFTKEAAYSCVQSSLLPVFSFISFFWVGSQIHWQISELVALQKCNVKVPVYLTLALTI